MFIVLVASYVSASLNNICGVISLTSMLVSAFWDSSFTCDELTLLLTTKFKSIEKSFCGLGKMTIDAEYRLVCESGAKRTETQLPGMHSQTSDIDQCAEKEIRKQTKSFDSIVKLFGD